MPFSHDRPSLEASPEDHDAKAIAAGSTERDVENIEDILRLHGAPEGPILDIGCGSGRHVRALVAAGYTCHGLDLDARMLNQARAASAHLDPCRHRYIHGDVCDTRLPERYAAITCLNHSLVCFHSHRLAWGLFRFAAEHLLPGGCFCIDNCCTPLWDQVREGLFADGISEDGDEQLLFLPGENRFTWRQGAAVDPDDMEIRDSDRLYRLWSLGEVALAGAGTGLAPGLLSADAPLLVLIKATE